MSNTVSPISASSESEFDLRLQHNASVPKNQPASGYEELSAPRILVVAVSFFCPRDKFASKVIKYLKIKVHGSAASQVPTNSTTAASKLRTGQPHLYTILHVINLYTF